MNELLLDYMGFTDCRRKLVSACHAIISGYFCGRLARPSLLRPTLTVLPESFVYVL